MKRLLILSLLFMPTMSLAQAVPPELTVKVSPVEADLIWKGLRKLPVEEVESVMNKMRQQIMEQTQPKVTPVPEPKKE